MYLTGKEIKDLAEYAGFTISASDEDCEEQEYYVSKCPENGVLDDGGDVKHYSHIVTCDGCEGNECSPLGNEIK